MRDSIKFIAMQIAGMLKQAEENGLGKVVTISNDKVEYCFDNTVFEVIVKEKEVN